MLADDDVFLSKAEVRSKVKLSYAEIARRQRKGTFPPSIALGPHRNSRRVFLLSSIVAWMSEQIAAALARDVSSK
jgi:predicted DNA-binding transcriptional regulator AlpA